MFDLIIANLQVRPFRTMLSVVGVAIGVVLVVLFTGLARGMSNDMAKRAANWKAEIVFTRAGAMSLDSSNMSVNTAYVPRLLEVEGVKSAVPVGRYITPDTRGRWGIQQLDGVEWDPFAEMNEMSIVQGRAAIADNEVMVDERQLRDDQAKLGDTIRLFGDRDFTIVGVFSPPSGSRIKMSLTALQNALKAKDRSTYILVKLKAGQDIDTVAARINEALPGNKINLTRDLIIDAQERIPALNTFLRVLVGLAAFVSTIFVLLSMYTTVTERRKEIGILKSLGASKAFIIRAIEGEALLIGLLGIALGLVVAYLGSELIWRIFELQFEFSLGWVATAMIIAIAGSLFGALYPAWRASVIDPVEVMANE